MKNKILKSMLLLSLITALLTSALLSFAFYHQLSSEIKREMKAQAVCIAAGIEAEGLDYLKSFEMQKENARITLIGQSGIVLFDNRASAEEMDNHKDRPEILSASQYGIGEAVRMSDTIGSQTYYIALRLSDETILRISKTTDTFFMALKSIMPYAGLMIFAILLLAFFVAGYQTRKIVKPINILNLEDPAECEVYEELSPLLIRIHQQRKRIEDQMKELEQKKCQFDEITENMSEGLLVLDARGNVLSVNRSALIFLGADNMDYEGKHFSILNRDLSLQRVVQATQDGISSEERFETGQNYYQIHATPVFENEEIKGSILLIFDITEKQKTEVMRREFTANVSHELKTPLTSIAGISEMLKNNMVKQDDVSHFAGNIHKEAKRMIALINDTIKLSELDEGAVNGEWEETDLYEIAKDVCDYLSASALSKSVTFVINEKHVVIKGVRQIIWEMIYNLVDNAIKYNKENGTVEIEIRGDADKAELIVKDTGIGIASQDLDRVFERFYRVDKSHSKNIEGTGLGLSIVKHGAKYHNAKVHIKSELQRGTEVSIEWPQ